MATIVPFSFPACYAAPMPPSIRDGYPPPWHVEPIPGGFKVVSHNGIALAYIYALEGHARFASPNTLTLPEARAILSASRMKHEEPRNRALSRAMPYSESVSSTDHSMRALRIHFA